MLAFVRRIITPATPSQVVQDKPAVETPPHRAKRPAGTKRPAGKRGVKLPNGIVISSTWYRPPRFDGRMSMSEVRAMDAAYRSWYQQKHGRPYAG